MGPPRCGASLMRPGAQPRIRAPGSGTFGRPPDPPAGEVAAAARGPTPADRPAAAVEDRPGGQILGSLEEEVGGAGAYWELTGTPGSGNASLWVRLPELTDASAA